MSIKLISVVEGKQDITRADAKTHSMLDTHYDIKVSDAEVMSTIFTAFCEVLRDRGYVKMEALQLLNGLTEGMLFSLFNEEELHDCTTKGRCSPDRIKIVFQPEGRIELHHNEDLFEAFLFATQGKLKSKYKITILKLSAIKAIVTTFIRALYEDDFNTANVDLDLDNEIQIAMVDTERLQGDGTGSIIGAEMIRINTNESELIDLV